MNSKAQVKGKLGHVVQIHVCRLPLAANMSLNLSVSCHSFEINTGFLILLGVRVMRFFSNENVFLFNMGLHSKYLLLLIISSSLYRRDN